MSRGGWIVRGIIVLYIGFSPIREVAQLEQEIIPALPEKKYKSLLSDIKDIITERVYSAREEIVHMKWEIGDAIVSAQENHTVIVQRLSQDLSNNPGNSESELYRCIKFRELYPTWTDVLGKLPGGKNISWNKIRETILPKQPMGKLSLTFPEVEVLDKWGIIKWYMGHENHVAVVIKDPKYPISLKITEVKNEKTEGQPETPLKEAFTQIRQHYITVKGWKESDLNHDDYARIHRSAKSLLVKAKGDIARIKAAITWIGGRDYIDWTIETVEKKWADFQKANKPRPIVKVEVATPTKDRFQGSGNIKELLKNIGGPSDSRRS